MLHSRTFAGLALALSTLSACGGGGGSSPVSPTTTTPPPATTPTPTPTATPPVITVSSTGVSPQELVVAAGTRVTFTNTDNRAHDFSGGPDPATPECPEIDVAGFVAPGQSRQTGTFTTARTCRFHDHAYLGVPAFTGRIVIQ